MQKKLLAVDGNSLINRAFYGVKPLTTRDGRNTNAVFGFINMLTKALDDIKPDYAALCFDLKKPTFRHEAYDFYKANRKGMPEELHEQLDDAKNAGKHLGFHILTCEGFEADDILGTLSSFADENTHVYVMTGDRDSYQLVRDNVSVLYVSTKETVLTDENVIAEKYDGLKPHDLIELKALMGDTSDNIPGVKGIGEKTALGLVKQFGTVENLYNTIDSADNLTKSVRAKLEEGKEMAFASRFLAEIKLDAPLGIQLSDIEYSGKDREALLALCRNLELFSIIKRLGLEESMQGSLFDGEDEALSSKEFDVCFEEKACGIESIACAYVCHEGKKIYIKTCDGKYFCVPATEQNFTDLFCKESNEIILHDVKSLQVLMYGLGCGEIKAKYFDICLASYVCDPASVMTAERLFAGKTLCGDENTDKNVYASVLDFMCELKDEFSERIEQNGQRELLYNVEFPLSLVLASMEHEGFLIDKAALEKYGLILDSKIEACTKEIFAYSEGEFNINSPKQLGEVLFERLLLPAPKKTKTGYSTDAETLEKLRSHHPIIDAILEYRTVAKLKSTYADGLIKAIGDDGRLHTNFKQAFTLTGRLSSAEPNLQNIPIRTAEGREIRKVFIPAKGNVLVDADYSQIELRLMAAMSGDENMIKTYADGRDIHSMTASQVFGVCEDDVTPDMRKKAKAVNFGIIYGISDFSLAGDIKVTKKEAAQYIERYFEKYPAVKEYLDNIKKKAFDDGYVSTLFARRRYVPEIRSRIYKTRTFGERVAMNAPIQGTAADIIKIEMVRVYNRLKEEKLPAKLILQVHDELIVECEESCAQTVLEILEQEMSQSAQLCVGLEVSTGIGYNWESCH